MILAIDTGNTSIHFGCYAGSRLVKQWKLPSRPLPSARRLARQLAPHRLSLAKASKVVVCSVVPSMTRVLVSALRNLTKSPILLVGRDVRVALRNRYRKPGQVGQDRLVGAYAAWCLYGDGARRARPGGRNPERAHRRESRDCVIVDFGTAITIDLVTRAGDYLGGIIAPGPDIALEALALRTALLPRVSLAKPPALLGRDTAGSIRSGVVYGSAALCDGLVAHLKRRYAPRAVVIATGGASPLIAPYSRQIDHVRPTLVLDGLRALAG